EIRRDVAACREASAAIQYGGDGPERTRRQDFSWRCDRFAFDAVGWWPKPGSTARQWLPCRLGARSLSRGDRVRRDGRSRYGPSPARLSLPGAAEARWQLPAKLVCRWTPDRQWCADGPGRVAARARLSAWQQRSIDVAQTHQARSRFHCA